MPLCVCYSCGRKIDCSPDGVCEICEINVSRDGDVNQSDVAVLSHMDTRENISVTVEAPKLTEETWHLKCCQVGCRALGVVMHSGEWWCGKHYNNMVRLNCIQKGCSHPIPEPM